MLWLAPVFLRQLQDKTQSSSLGYIESLQSTNLPWLLPQRCVRSWHASLHILLLLPCRCERGVLGAIFFSFLCEASDLRGGRRSKARAWQAGLRSCLSSPSTDAERRMPWLVVNAASCRLVRFTVSPPRLSLFSFRQPPTGLVGRPRSPCTKAQSRWCVLLESRGALVTVQPAAAPSIHHQFGPSSDRPARHLCRRMQCDTPVS